MWARLFEMLTAAGRAVIALFLVIVLASALRLDAVAWPVLLGVLALAAVAAWRPGAALLLLAALVPVAGYGERWWSPGVNWSEMLIVAFAAGWSVRALVEPRREPPANPPPWRTPLVVFVLVICASVAVQFSLDHVRLGTRVFAGMLWARLARNYFVGGSNTYIYAAAFLLEGLLLFSAAARLVESEPRLRGRLARTLAASLTVATALNVARLVSSASRSDNFWPSLAAVMSGVRIDLHFGDFNAAGSVLAMVVLTTLALALSRRQARGWLAAAAVLALGLWMSGSRAALLAVTVAAGMVVAAVYGRSRARGRPAIWIAAGVLLLLGLVAIEYAPARGNQKLSSVAARVRIELARTTLRMVAERPVFGIGLGEFYQRSGEFSSPELLALFPPARHENAHNNFLQILGETGVFGLAIFLWLIGTALYCSWREAARHPSVLKWGVLAGVVAFLFTCLGGHPLLTREPAYIFWMTLGVAAAANRTSESSTRARNSSTGRYLIVGALVVLVASLPVRARRQLHDADLEHVGVNVSVWQTAEDGLRYRWADGEATVFVPRRAGGFLVRLRTTEGPANVELWLEGRLVNVVRVDPSRWSEVRMPLPHEDDPPKFSPLRIRSTPAQRLMIGKVEPL